MRGDLYPWQQDMVDFASERPKCILAAAPGTGKSRASLEAFNLGGAGRKLVIAVPPHLALNWMREIKKWTPELLPHTQRVRASKERHTGRVVVISYQMLVTWMKAGKLKKPDCLIIDEAHAIKTPKAKRTQALMRLIKAVDQAMLLSGSIIVNRPSELGSALLAFKAVKSRKTFESVYCGGWQAPWGWQRDGKFDAAQLRELLDPWMLVVPKSVLGQAHERRTPPRIIEVEVSGRASREKAFDRHEVAKNPNTVAFEGMSELMAWHGEQKVPYAVPHIQNVLESEEKVIVFYWHVEVGKALCEAMFKHIGDKAVFNISGAVGLKQAVVDQFEEHEGPAVLIANHRAAGTGLNITCSSYIIFVESPWGPGDVDQCISRADRIGQNEIVRTDFLTIAGSIDAHIIHALIDKAEIIEEVVDKMAKKVKVNELDRAMVLVYLDYCEKRRVSAEELIEAVVAETDAKAIEKHSTGKVEEEKPKPKKKAAAKKPEPKPVSLSEVRLAARKYMNAAGGPALKALLDEFGAPKLSALTKDQYDDFIAKAAA